MRWNFFREIARKGIHLTILIVIAAYITLDRIYGKAFALLALTALLLIILILEYLRLDWDVRNPVIDFLIRPKEIGRIHGAVYFVSATIISLAVFDFIIALTVLLMATFGDMFAAIIGERYGHIMIFKKKTLVGTMAELITNLIIGFSILAAYTNIYTIIAMAFTATLVETVLENIDDNLAIPLFSGFVGQVLILI